MADKTKICILSSVPSTLRVFYSSLLKKLNEHDFEITLISSNSKELELLGKEFHCNVFAAHIVRQISPLCDAQTIYTLVRYFRRQKFRIVHAHTPKGGFVGMIASWVSRVPFRVYTIHGLVLETSRGIKKKLLWMAEWLSCRMATHVIAVSPSLRHRVIEEGLCPSEKIDVLASGSACGIDLAKYTKDDNFSILRACTRARYGISEEAVVIGYVGRIVPDKGIELLVDSFEIVQRANTDIYLLLVGSMEVVRDGLKKQTIEKMNRNEHIIFNNEFVSDIINYYAAMDMLILPSRREGFGLTLIEAAALGIPTVATKVTGCVDAVVDGMTGLLVDPDDIQELSQVILRLIKHPQLRRKLGENGCRRAKLFDEKELVREHVKLYQRFLQGR